MATEGYRWCSPSLILQILVWAKLFDIMPLYVRIYSGNQYQSSNQNLALVSFTVDSGCIYIYILFYSLISIYTIELFHVRTKLNKHVLQYSGLKCMYKIEPLQIDCNILQASNVFFSKYDQIFNHICIAITFNDKLKNQKIT